MTAWNFPASRAQPIACLVLPSSIRWLTPSVPLDHVVDDQANSGFVSHGAFTNVADLLKLVRNKVNQGFLGKTCVRTFQLLLLFFELPLQSSQDQRKRWNREQ